jgi:hypothetical protein
MNRPYMKNHTAIGDIKNMAQLFQAFKKRKSIYFRPLNRIMPVKFFTGWSWGLDNLQRHIDLSSFYDVMPKDECVRSRIRNMIYSYPIKEAVKVAEDSGKMLISKGSWNKLFVN